MNTLEFTQAHTHIPLGSILHWNIPLGMYPQTEKHHPHTCAYVYNRDLEGQSPEKPQVHSPNPGQTPWCADGKAEVAWKGSGHPGWEVRLQISREGLGVQWLSPLL